MSARPAKSSQAKVDALKHLPTDDDADLPSLDCGATRLDALLPAILDRAFKGEW